MWRIAPGATLGLLLMLAAGQLTAVGGPLDKDKGKNKGKKGDREEPSKTDGVITNWGKPKGFAAGKVNAFWLWYEDELWHLRTTGGGVGSHQFSGRIEVSGGRLSELTGKKGEYRGKLADRYVYNAARTRIDFEFATDEHVDGLNFAVDNPAATITLGFALDGQEKPQHVRIGKNGDHPARWVFTVPGVPKNTAKK